jgi:hypothetical protein
LLVVAAVVDIAEVVAVLVDCVIPVDIQLYQEILTP